jgi:hypothetical protein
MFQNIKIVYCVMLMLSTKKNFSAMGRFFNFIGKVISKLLRPADFYYGLMLEIAKCTFKDSKRLYLILDDTLLRKIYSRFIEGTGWFYCTKTGKKILSFKLLTAMLSNGKISLPFFSTFLFSNELDPKAKETRKEWVEKIIRKVQKLFPDKEIIVVGDGAFGTKEFLRWCEAEKIEFEGRVRRNAVVVYKGKKINICDIEELKPVGRQKARTISAEWDGIPVYITAELRENKHEKTIVYQVSNFKEKPHKHVAIYVLRWTIEMCFRTTKQYLGLQDCYSTDLATQEAHIGASLLACGFLRLDEKIQRLKSPEQALKAADLKNVKNFIRYLNRLDRLFCHIDD